MGAHTSNPVRIERIGTDHVQVFIRPALGDAELLAGVERIERLFDAGFGAIAVVFDAETHGGSHLAGPLETDTGATNKGEQP